VKILFIFLLLIISCSGEKFDGEKKQGIQAFIDFEVSRTMNLNLYPWIETEDCYYFWIVNGDTVSSNRGKAIYGWNSLKLVLVDAFGDTTIGDSLNFLILKISLLSPVDSFSTDLPVSFRYEINGENEWEGVYPFVYTSKDRDSLWRDENRRDENSNNILEPPYFWGVRAFTEYGSVFSEEIRWIQPKN